MLFSARAEYACLAMLELAAQYGDPRPVRLTDIANKHGISSPRFLVQILIQLNKKGLVTSTRGRDGGYHLAKRPSDVTLADVIAA
ncbi:MAG: Rrf2 family transcriptional regulator, partial [Planctomycetia bacterium]|nr:Rrf2 family transcriptional regulator [Planctomycetia bacterium]